MLALQHSCSYPAVDPRILKHTFTTPYVSQCLHHAVPSQHIYVPFKICFGYELVTYDVSIVLFHIVLTASHDLYQQRRAFITRHLVTHLLGENSCGCQLTGTQSACQAVVVSAHGDKGEDKGEDKGDDKDKGDSASDQQFAKLVERIKDDEGMQQALYAYIPDDMHNKEAVVRMVSSPEYRQMLESMMQVQSNLDIRITDKRIIRQVDGF